MGSGPASPLPTRDAVTFRGANDPIGRNIQRSRDANSPTDRSGHLRSASELPRRIRRNGVDDVRVRGLSPGPCSGLAGQVLRQQGM